MAFKTIHTSAGLTRLAAAEASGTPINITAMAVGDGNGNATTPSASQTALVREVYRHAPNRVYQDANDAKLFTAELVVPASVSGFTMREVAVFDADGAMIVVGNLPDTYKPNVADGSFTDAIVRVQFYVSNASVVTIILDPSVAVASQQWVINNMTPAVLFPGGTTHQVLRKKSNADGDTEWADITDVTLVVSAIEETQTLAAGQTVVDWATVTNEGLAVYIEGVRIKAAKYTKHPSINTRITLSQSYPAGTEITGTQNEPASTLTEPLDQAQNLADLPDKSVARTNLDVYSKAEVRAMVPPGIVDHYAGSTPPSGWLVRDGSAISRTAYAQLFFVLGTTFGAGDGVNTFNLPDDRGLFDRGWDGTRGVDTGRVFGSEQLDAFQGHEHSMPDVGGCDGGAYDGGGNQPRTRATNTIVQKAGYSVPRVADETRPRNRAYLPIIKF